MKTVFFVIGFIGSILMIWAGVDMTFIESVAGDTIAEAFYNAFGFGFIGLGLFSAMALAMFYHHTSSV